MLKQGDTFLISSPRNEVEHLWIVLTEPDEENQSLCVNITTAQDGSDLTVELNKGDHPFIKHPSVVNYFDARLMVLQDVETMIAMPHKTRVCAKDHPCENIERAVGVQVHTKEGSRVPQRPLARCRVHDWWPW